MRARRSTCEREDRGTIERYDTSKFRVGKKVFQPSSLGRQMLLARRLVEAGCGFVTVQNSGWDMHADGNNPGIGRRHGDARPAARQGRQRVSRRPRRARPLTEKVLLVITGDFGRTPTINENGGRDHWPKLCTLAFAGGGLARGQVIGQSTPQERRPRDRTDPARRTSLSTVMHALFDVGQMRLDPGVPRDLARLAEAPPIAELA